LFVGCTPERQLLQRSGNDQQRQGDRDKEQDDRLQRRRKRVLVDRCDSQIAADRAAELGAQPCVQHGSEHRDAHPAQSIGARRRSLLAGIVRTTAMSAAAPSGTFTS
jgi:hypothetical protein